MRQTTIFFGNGINRLSTDGKSWDNVLRQINIVKSCMQDE